MELQGRGWRPAVGSVGSVLLVLAALSVGAGEQPFRVLGIGGGGGMFTPAVSPHRPGLMLLSCDMSGSYRAAGFEGLKRLHGG